MGIAGSINVDAKYISKLEERTMISRIRLEKYAKDGDSRLCV